MLKYMAAEFLLEYTTVPEVLYIRKTSSLSYEDGHIRHRLMWLFFFFFSKVYPLFIPRKNACTGGEETSLSESGSSNFGVDSVDSVKKQSFGSTRSNSFNLSGASSHSMERHQYLQRGISLLKTSVTAITTYYYNSLGLDVPSNLSTFEAFSKLLHTLSSSKAFRTAFELNIASRYLLT
jgi:hypothetical protein